MFIIFYLSFARAPELFTYSSKFVFSLNPQRTSLLVDVLTHSERKVKLFWKYYEPQNVIAREENTSKTKENQKKLFP